MRTAKARGIGKHHPLTDVLIAQGFSVRQARQIVNALFLSIKTALLRHEDVELPFGTLRVVPQAVQPYRRWWRGRPVEFYARPFRVEFIPLEEQ